MAESSEESQSHPQQQRRYPPRQQGRGGRPFTRGYHNEPPIRDLREVLNRKRQERQEPGRAPPEPSYNYLHDPEREQDTEQRTPSRGRGGYRGRGTGRDIESPKNIKVEVTIATGEHVYTMDESVTLPTIKHVPDQRPKFYNRDRGGRGRGRGWGAPFRGQGKGYSQDREQSQGYSQDRGQGQGYSQARGQSQEHRQDRGQVRGYSQERGQSQGYSQGRYHTRTINRTRPSKDEDNKQQNIVSQQDENWDDLVSTAIATTAVEEQHEPAPEHEPEHELYHEELEEVYYEEEKPPEEEQKEKQVILENLNEKITVHVGEQERKIEIQEELNKLEIKD